jgi:hypothetical protein
MPTTDASAIEDVADTLFRAIEGSDVGMIEELWNDDIVVWHSGDRADNDRAKAMRVICWFINCTSRRRYEILDRRLFDGGFVQQHILPADPGAHRTARRRLAGQLVTRRSGGPAPHRPDPIGRRGSDSAARIIAPRTARVTYT